MLSGSDAIHMATVLEDCVDQLSVLGKIMPASFEGRPDALSVSTSFFSMISLFTSLLDACHGNLFASTGEICNNRQ